MTVFKCKMCGGSIEFEQGTSVGVCSSCGTKQTLPRLDDDRRANLYNRANHFRRNNEFDKASGIYEQILTEDNTDAEAYWSLVLCRFGIEYVEDPATHNRVPTVNRTQFTSVFDDDNYKSALKYADSRQRSIYEEEANAINEIQKGILAISQKEEPFDVFICYKETDDNGRRTPDSVLANDLYHQLTQEGFKVFFSRITLEDKLGTAYEPYIFAALNSSKVMVVIGTKAEYFNAPWVKNEWSRYLGRVKESEGKKLLIPAYKDMNPYDLPDEFSHLQSQDMTKLGFMQDLLRGIRKIVRPDEPKPFVVVDSGSPRTEPLLKRAFIFLEDGNWQDADAYCERVLDREPENAQAYLGKLMAELHIRRREDITGYQKPLNGSNNYQKLVRFGNGQMDDVIQVHERNENARLTGIYQRAVAALEGAKTENACKNAAAIFKTIPGFKDADTLAAKCLDKAEVCRKDAVYAYAKSQMTGEVTTGYSTAILSFQNIPGWRDTDEQILICKRKIEEINAKKERAQKEAEEAKRRKAAMERLRTVVVNCVIIGFILAILAVWGVMTVDRRRTVRNYDKAAVLYESGKYEDAMKLFEDLGSYRDSREKLIDCKYCVGKQLKASGKYEDAMKLFEDLGSYRDSREKLIDCKYRVGKQLKGSGKYEEAFKYLVGLHYEDSEDLLKDCKYNIGKKKYEAGDFEGAYEYLNGLDYKDSEKAVYKILSSKPQLKLRVLQPGDVYIFGSYEQDNDTSNGKEPIQWLVLEKKDNELLLISKYALDSKPYNTSYTKTTWEACSLKAWLNSDFMSTAFTLQESKIIGRLEVTKNDSEKKFGDMLSSAQDIGRVFLLSIDEVNQYLNSNEKRKCKATKYAISQGVNQNDSLCLWWLRSSGHYANRAAYVSTGGSVSGYGNDVDYDRGAVRPALWINLSP